MFSSKKIYKNFYKKGCKILKNSIKYKCNKKCGSIWSEMELVF